MGTPRPDLVPSLPLLDIEHGHTNNFSNDYASVAYSHQTPAVPVTDTLPSRLAVRRQLGLE